jgi:adenylate cyclase
MMRNVAIPTDPDGRVWIRYNVGELAPSLSADDILEGGSVGDRVAGRIVLVGSSAAGLGDIKTVPGGASMPGVQVQAQLLATLSSGAHLRRPPAVAGAERAALVAVGLILAWYAPLLRAAWLPPLLAATILGSFAATWLGFGRYGLLIDGGYLAVALSLLLFWLAMAKFIREEARRRTIRDAFGHYLAPAMVDRLASSRRELRLGGERRELTVLFSDIRGFTTLSERFARDPEALTRLLNRYLTTMTEAIQAAQGTIDKYIGDAIMAFWGAPLPVGRHAEAACRAALAMRERLGRFNAEIAAEHLGDNLIFEPLRMGIGINTGECFVGNLGSDQRFNYSVLGDAVNVASRLEGRSKAYGIDIVLGETTRAAVPELAALELDRVRLASKTDVTRIYGLLGDEALMRDERFLALTAAHEGMLAAYRARDWDEAERGLRSCRAWDDGFGLGTLYDIYADRLRRYRDRPPPEGWDGSELALSKD